MGMRFRRETLPPPNLSEGASFRRSRGSDIVETAKIIAVKTDPLGIPHVRFSLRVSGPGDMPEEQRTLALDWFTTLYREPIGA
jgi:hypothetical protein